MVRIPSTLVADSPLCEKEEEKNKTRFPLKDEKCGARCLLRDMTLLYVRARRTGKILVKLHNAFFFPWGEKGKTREICQ